MSLEKIQVIGPYKIIQYSLTNNRFTVDPTMTRDSNFVDSLPDEIKALVSENHTDALADQYLEFLNNHE